MVKSLEEKIKKISKLIGKSVIGMGCMYAIIVGMAGSRIGGALDIAKMRWPEKDIQINYSNIFNPIRFLRDNRHVDQLGARAREEIYTELHGKIISGTIHSKHYFFDYEKGILSSSTREEFKTSVTTDDNQILVFEGWLNNDGDLNSMLKEGDSVKIRLNGKSLSGNYWLSKKVILEINDIKNPLYESK